MNTDSVVLVDNLDKPVGIEEKLKAHTGKGIRHRAVSVLVIRKTGDGAETLIQKRSATKILWPEFWSNSICTHPKPDETYESALVRRLKEEMGIDVPISFCRAGFRMEYQAQYTEKYAEFEVDTVVFCLWDGKPEVNPEEVSNWKWISWESLKKDMQERPAKYTPWFHLIVSNPKTEQFITSL